MQAATGREPSLFEGRDNPALCRRSHAFTRLIAVRIDKIQQSVLLSRHHGIATASCCPG